MTEFRLTQISDTHLARRHQKLTDNFHRVSEYIDATRPDLVVNSGDLAFDAPTNRDDLEFAKDCTMRFRSPAVPARQSRHRRQPDRGRSGSVATGHRTRAADLSLHVRRRPLAFRRSRLVFYRAEFADHEHRTLRARPSSSTGSLRSSRATDGKPVALFLHKPLFLNSPDDPELAATAIRYVPMPARQPPGRDVWRRRSAADRQRPRSPAPRFHLFATPGTSGRLRPASSFRMRAGTDRRQGVGLVEYRFQPDSFEVRSRPGAGPDRCRSGFADRLMTRKPSTPYRSGSAAHALSGPTRTSCLPKLSPLSRPMKAAGALSRPSVMNSRA